MHRTPPRSPVAGLLAVVALALALFAAAGAPGAQAASGGVERTPVMGWSSWSFLRMGVDAANIEAEARALAHSPLRAVGYRYVNIDDNWYRCPGRAGPTVDRYGRWVIDARRSPPTARRAGSGPSPIGCIASG